MVNVSVIMSCFGVMSGVFLACALGIPVPEEITLLSAGVLVSAKQVPLYLVTIPSLVGIVLSDSILFFLGRLFGRRVFQFPFLLSVLTPQRIQWAESHIRRNGPLTCFVGRFIPGLRVVIFTTSGALGIKASVFLAVDILAAVIIVSLWISVGYWMGSSFVDATSHAQDIKIVVIVATILLFVITLSWRFMGRKRIGLSKN